MYNCIVLASGYDSEPEQRLNRREERVTAGRIENWQPGGEADVAERVGGEQLPVRQTKYRRVHEILAAGPGEGDGELRPRRAGCGPGQKDGEERRAGCGPGQEGGIGGGERRRAAYRAAQTGGEIPAAGLAEEWAKERVEHGTEYQEDRIHIHYKTVVRSQVKEAIPEEELEQQLEQRMLGVYQKLAERKLQERLRDYEDRKHSDNLLPDEKAILLARLSRPELADQQQARALYNFTAESDKELSLNKYVIHKSQNKLCDAGGT